MPVKHRLRKQRPHRITPAAIEAFEAGDYLRLHRALGLGPHQPSPLPESIEPLGVNPDREPIEYPPGAAWRQEWPLAVELQRELLAAGARLPTRARED